MKAEPTAVLMVEVSITEEEPGFFMATSPDLPGLMLGHESVDTLLRELPEVIAAIARKKYETELYASPIERTNSSHTYMHRMPWALIPPAVIAQANKSATAQ